jgi:hypothetical protein
LLIAFLAAVMVSGGGGVRAPWVPAPADVTTRPVVIAHVDPVMGGLLMGGLRME